MTEKNNQSPAPVNSDREIVLKQLKRAVPALVAFTIATLLVKYYG